MDDLLLFAAIAVPLFFLLFVIFRREWTLWLEARLSGAPVRALDLVRMRLRGIDARPFVKARMTAAATRCHVPPEELLRHHLAGGRVVSVIEPVVSASRRRLDVPFEKACALDLEGLDVLGGVTYLINHEDAPEDDASSIAPPKSGWSVVERLDSHRAEVLKRLSRRTESKKRTR